jgi:hypothetical protein
MLASRCTLPADTLPLQTVPAVLQCRPGTGLILFGVPHPLADTAAPLGDLQLVGYKNCSWSTPEYTNIPDSHSRTCTSSLPDGRIYMVGAQLTGGRDPLVLSISSDGLVFDHAWAVRAHAPPIRYPGNAKGPGFQYPGGLYVNGTLFVSYSINKEDIAVTWLPISTLR